MRLVMRRGISIHPTPNNGPPWRNDRTGRTDDRRCHDGRRRHDGSPAAGGDAASTNHATSANDGARFHGAYSEEASCQQYGNHKMFHDGSPRVAILWFSRFRIACDFIRVD